jgi:hypothetical protein
MKTSIIVLALFFGFKLFALGNFNNENANVCESLCCIKKIVYDDLEKRHYVFSDEYFSKVSNFEIDPESGSFVCFAEYENDAKITVKIDRENYQMHIMGYVFNEKILPMIISADGSLTLKYKKFVRANLKDFYLISCEYEL